MESRTEQYLKNVGVGVDIELISKFGRLDRNKEYNFLSKVFTEEELDYCFSKRMSAQHLAARFAAKEAIFKAISSLGQKAPPLNKINIEKDVGGVPKVNLGGYEIKISLSHCNDKAIAFAILIKVDK